MVISSALLPRIGCNFKTQQHRVPSVLQWRCCLARSVLSCIVFFLLCCNSEYLSRKKEREKKVKHQAGRHRRVKLVCYLLSVSLHWPIKTERGGRWMVQRARRGVYIGNNRTVRVLLWFPKNYWHSKPRPIVYLSLSRSLWRGGGGGRGESRDSSLSVTPKTINLMGPGRRWRKRPRRSCASSSSSWTPGLMRYVIEIFEIAARDCNGSVSYDYYTAAPIVDDDDGAPLGPTGTTRLLFPPAPGRVCGMLCCLSPPPPGPFLPSVSLSAERKVAVIGFSFPQFSAKPTLYR